MLPVGKKLDFAEFNPCGNEGVFMNRRLGTFVVALLCGFAMFCTTALAQGAAEELKKIEKDRAAAVVKGDWEKLAKETADDYTFVTMNGQMTTKAQMIEGFKSGQSKLTTDEVSDMSVRIYGDVAVITGKLETKGTLGGKDVSGHAMFTRVYVKKTGHWESVALQQTRTN